MATAAHTTPEQTLFITFNPSDKRAQQFIASLKMLDFFRIEKSPYSPAFVKKIRRAEKSKKHFVINRTLISMSASFL